ncbi:MAG: MBL fold metallo-hydrolase [Bacillota bacterium]|nr:MBL fold metallo-hydrolase [Bacillota bacterium]MDI7250061.1 MBL fold metallo-hydrolase [Bacillota bacterium]
MRVEIQWLGHACFLLTSPGGTRVVTDPFNEQVGYKVEKVAADLVTVSHEHFDHNHAQMVNGSPQVVRALTPAGDWAQPKATVGDVTVSVVPTYHDPEQGAKRGKNGCFILDMGGVRVVHLGDLGHVLSADQGGAFGAVDILLTPVGGFYTIGPAEADQVIELLRPRVVIPMHFKTAANADWPIGGVEEFLRGKQGVRRMGGSTAVVEKAQLPSGTEYWVLEPAWL